MWALWYQTSVSAHRGQPNVSSHVPPSAGGAQFDSVGQGDKAGPLAWGLQVHPTSIRRSMLTVIEGKGCLLKLAFVVGGHPPPVISSDKGVCR